MTSQAPSGSRRPASWPEDFPIRSQLFGATPYGIDGATRESVMSFFRRTANAHGLLPRSLAYYVIVPPMGIPTLISADFTADECYRKNLCGMSASAARWIAVLNDLTSRSDLQLLTLSSLKNLVSSYQLLDSKNRFCPLCYAEDERAGREKYDRLLWTIRCVTACPLHLCRLIVEPPFKGHRPFSFTVPGTSRIDGTSLANVASERASNYEIEASKKVSGLIDYLSIETYTKSSLPDFLSYVTHNFFDGNSAALARHLGISKSQIHGWMNDAILPSLAFVTRLSYAFDCTIVDILSANTVGIRLHHGRKFCRRLFDLARRVGYKVPREELLASLATFLMFNPNSNAIDAARHLDVSPKFLRENFPEKNEALVIAGRLHQQRTSQERKDAKDHAYQESRLALRDSGTYPSRRKIVKKLQEQGIRLTYADERRAARKARAAAIPNHPF
ncbi:TniQ family protein [Paraburkholderia sp. BR10936]|uniref:TniQ family protein n=1 Tax=Paraburkholderia sp. BR10936 TaxID=3236993 RepID=UPI0034D1D2CF